MLLDISAIAMSRETAMGCTSNSIKHNPLCFCLQYSSLHPSARSPQNANQERKYWFNSTLSINFFALFFPNLFVVVFWRARENILNLRLIFSWGIHIAQVLFFFLNCQVNSSYNTYFRESFPSDLKNSINWSSGPRLVSARWASIKVMIRKLNSGKFVTRQKGNRIPQDKIFSISEWSQVLCLSWADLDLP